MPTCFTTQTTGSSPPVHGTAIGRPLYRSPLAKRADRGMRFANVPGGRPELVEKDNSGPKGVSGVPVSVQTTSDKFGMSGVMRFKGRNPTDVNIPSSIVGRPGNLDAFGNVVFPWTGTPEQQGLVASGSFEIIQTAFSTGFGNYAHARSGSKFYTLYGFSSTGTNGYYASGTYRNDVYVYDQLSGSWYNFGFAPSGSRRGSSALLENGVLMVVGGYNELDASTSREAFAYRDYQGFWCTLSQSSVSRRDSEIALIDNATMLMGPGYYYNGMMAKCETRNLYSDVISDANLPPILPQKREGYTMTSIGNGQVIMLGGIDSDTGEPLSHAFLYKTGSWAVLPSMSLPRAYHQAVYVPGGSVYVFGGIITSGSDATGLVEKVTASNGVWSITPVGEMLTPRSHFAAAIYGSDDGRVLLCGGRNGLEVLSGTEVFDIGYGVSHRTANMPYQMFNHAAYATLCNERDYVVITGPGDVDYTPPARPSHTSSLRFTTTG